MIHRRTALPGHGRGPFARVVLAVVSTAALVGAAIVGAFVFVALLGLFVLVAAGLWARVAWLRWRLRRGHAAPGTAGSDRARPRPGGTTLDGDYVVLPPQPERARR
jgi:hypothetical protein